MQVQVSEKDKLNIKNGVLLPVMEEFYSIQGEGFNSGKPAYFLRIGGCDVGCHWCDVKESWDASLHPLTNINEVCERILHYPSKSVVVTGGEPLMYNMNYLTSQFKQFGITSYLETSGAFQLTGTWDWICLSPKKNNLPLKEVFNFANELKVIIHNQNDFEWAEKNARQINSGSKLFLQPEWSKSKDMMPMIVEYVKQNPKWNISLQSHKYMNIP